MNGENKIASQRASEPASQGSERKHLGYGRFESASEILAGAEPHALAWARKEFMGRFAGVDRDGWGSFSFEAQGATEIRAAIKRGDAAYRGSQVQAEFVS